jgi:hypothetical protein
MRIPHKYIHMGGEYQIRIPRNWEYQIREIIEYIYSSPHKKSAATQKERKERVFVSILAKSREKHQNFKNPSKIKGL